jgi:hypothetical protein
MKLKLTFDKGLNADALPSELGDGFVSDCNGFRFRQGFAELVGGSGNVGVSFTGIGDSIFPYYTPTGRYVIASTGSGIYQYLAGGPFLTTAITLKTPGATIASATAVGTTVTITTVGAHGRTTGDVMSHWGFTPTEYNVDAVVITVTGVNTYTYTSTTGAPGTSPATKVGLSSYDLATVHTSTNTGGDLNGVFIMNTTSAGCLYWPGDANPVRRIVGSYSARSTVPFKNYVVQLAPTIDGVEYPYRILWSSASEPGSVPHHGFVASETNDAGDVDQPDIGEMVHAVPMGEDLIVYGTRGRLAMRYIGGNSVFSFTVLPGTEGLYNIKCVAETPVGHVFVDGDRHVKVHQGGVCRDISEGKVQSLLGQYAAAPTWVVNHSRQNEIWVGYGVNVSGATQYALIWNWEEETWGRTTCTNTTSMIGFRPSRYEEQSLYGVTRANPGVLQEFDLSTSNNGSSYLERKGIDGGDNDVVKNLQRSRWLIDQISGYAPSYQVSHGSSMFASTDPTYAASATYIPGTMDYCNKRATGGKYMAVKIVTTGTVGITSWPYYQIRVRTADLDFTAGGRR